MAPFKEDNYLIIQPGSQFTLCSFGRTNSQESLSLPTYKIPTRVYIENDEFKPTSTTGTEIYPIKQGKIVDVDAFNYFIKVILSSVMKDSEAFISPSAIAMSLISSNNFTKTQCEYITNYVFEKLEVGGFNIIPSALCSSFAYGSLQHSLVIDIGYDKIDISPIIDFQNPKHLNITIPRGSNLINENLAKLLPNLTSTQIESLKKSEIFEVLSEEDAKNSFFGIDALKHDQDSNDQDEGVLDVALIVTSDKDTRELLNKDKASTTKSNKPNSELEKNSFIDDEGNSIEVGKERFQGTKELLELISFNIKLTIDQIPDNYKRQECFENLILVGSSSKIKGFKDALYVQLLKDHLVIIKAKHHDEQSSLELAFRNETGPASLSATGGQNVNHQLLGSDNQIYNILQVPKSIRYLKFPDYFPIWKKLSNFEDLPFLGAQILTKQIFGTGHGNNYGEILYLNKDSYLSNGPVGIWDVAL